MSPANLLELKEPPSATIDHDCRNIPNRTAQRIHRVPTAEISRSLDASGRAAGLLIGCSGWPARVPAERLTTMNCRPQHRKARQEALKARLWWGAQATSRLRKRNSLALKTRRNFTCFRTSRQS